MVRRASARAVLLIASVATFVPLAASQPAHPLSNSTAVESKKPGFLDFVMNDVNRSHQDYGQCFDEARIALTDQTIKRATFWSAAVANAVAMCLFVVVIHQRRMRGRSERIAAISLAQYHNAWVRAERQVAEATTKNHALMKALTASCVISNDSPKRDVPKRKSDHPADGMPSTLPAAAAAAIVGTGGSQSLAEPTIEDPAKLSSDSGAALPEVSSPGTQAGLFPVEVDLVAKINSLQQQLNTSQEREKQLRRRLNLSELRFQKEEEKNRTLKSD